MRRGTSEVSPARNGTGVAPSTSAGASGVPEIHTRDPFGRMNPVAYVSRSFQ